MRIVEVAPSPVARSMAGLTPPSSARSVSLGYLGDAPIGILPTPPHRDPPWMRPFPCDWTDTCWARPQWPDGVELP